MRVSAATAPGTWLIYFGTHQPRSWSFGLPRVPGDYEIELIDTWSMEVTPLSPQAPPTESLPGSADDPGVAFSVELPGRPYLAVRVRQRP